MYVVRAETPPPHRSEVGEGVEHVLTTLAHGRVGRRATKGRTLGVWREDRSPGAGQGTDSTDLGHGVLSVPPTRSCPFLSSQKLSQHWDVAGNADESREERAQPVPAGPCTDAGMQEPFGNPSCPFSACLGSVQPVRSQRGRVPACVPAIRG